MLEFQTKEEINNFFLDSFGKVKRAEDLPIGLSFLYQGERYIAVMEIGFRNEIPTCRGYFIIRYNSQEYADAYLALVSVYCLQTMNEIEHPVSKQEIQELKEINELEELWLRH